MPLFDCTFIWDMPGHGFTATLRKEFASQNLDAAQDIAFELARRWQGMAGEQTVFQAVRISDAEAEGRHGRTYYRAIPGVTGRGSAASNVALNIVLGTANNQENKIIQFRGFWDDVELTGGAFDRNNAAFNTAFASWSQYIQQQQFGWRGVIANTIRNVTDYTEDANSVVTLTHDGAPFPFGALDTRKRSRLTGINVKSVLNGEQIIRVSGPNQVTLVKPIAAGPFISPGKITVSAFTHRIAVHVSAQRIGKRQAGAPLLRSRGRSPVRPRV